jgi:hypothetical protein
LNQDLALIEQRDGALDRLIAELRRNRADLQLHADDFLGSSKGARFYPLLYMLTRIGQAKDWASGIELKKTFSQLDVHHIFPKALLYKHGYTRPDVNAIANLTFLTQDTDLRVSDRYPAEYLEEFVSKQPGVIESHWIPTERRLWRVDNYTEFLAARRELLAQAANDILSGLLAGAVPEPIEEVSIVEREVTAMPRGEDEILIDCYNWVVGKGLPEGHLHYELTDLGSGEVLAILDLAWPDGLQERLSKPVALLIDEPKATQEAANRAGFGFFTDVDSFKAYVEREVLALEQEPRSAA